MKRRTVPVILMTQNVIDLVYHMAAYDNMPDGLKIETKSGILSYASSWITGVDYIEHENDDITINTVDTDNESQSYYDALDPDEIEHIVEENNPEQIYNPQNDDNENQT